MASVFSVIGAVGDGLVYGDNWFKTTTAVGDELTREMGKRFIKEVKAANRTWRKEKEKELKKLGYTDPEIDVILNVIEQEVEDLDL